MLVARPQCSIPATILENWCAEGTRTPDPRFTKREFGKFANSSRVHSSMLEYASERF